MTSPSSPLCFDHVGLVAADPDACIAFWTRLLDGHAAPQAGHTVVSAGLVRIAIVARRADDPPGHAFGHHLALRVPAARRAELLARLDALGAPREDVRGRTYSRDPDGNVLELVTVDDPVTAR